ncbi:hypothetical protein [Nocardia noduli]|uniref:hypothetical protein n=1 Tax=Nocardia noduli TaxID=2815722 RepID=UPI001C21E3CA|nr:hypothetical protein [Nocardia noduli]
MPTEVERRDLLQHWLDPRAVVPDGRDHTDLGLDTDVVDGVLRAFRIDSEAKLSTVAEAYRLIGRYLAPFVVKVVVDMVADLRGIIDREPNAKIVFVGRDGIVLGLVLGILQPDLVARHCVTMYLPRPLVDSALRDMEQNLGLDFSAIEVYRKRPTSTADPVGSRDRLTAYFALSGLDVESGDIMVCLVDTGLKGSIQEMLTAAYPTVRFCGLYAFFAAAPQDPHPGTKRGYVLHLDGAYGGDGTALRGELPADPALTFYHHEAIVAVEALLSGSKNSPVEFGRDGRPRLRRHRHDLAPLDGPLHGAVEPEYADPRVREAVLAMSTIAIGHRARELAPHVAAGRVAPHGTVEKSAWYRELAADADTLRDHVRAWVDRSDAVDQGFARLLDAFAPRAGDVAGPQDRLVSHTVQ